MTVAILLTPLEIVLKDALKIEAMKRPARPGNCPNVCITNKGYNCETKTNKKHILYSNFYSFIILLDLISK
jgi:hypothetical protein